MNDRSTRSGEDASPFETITFSELNEQIDAEDAALLANAERLNVSHVLEQYGTWVVTLYGVECLAEYYPIPKDDLHSPDWPLHMASKGWVNMYDFLTALEGGRAMYTKGGRRIVDFGSKKKTGRSVEKKTARTALSPRRRFAVLQRDSFRCGLCGRSAETDGVALHVDHQQPLSKGGLDTDENLWTLCAECNLGKSDRL